MIQNRNQNHLLYAIVFDYMVYPDPEFFIFKTKKTASFIFLSMEADFFDPMLPRKTFATNSLKYKFM